ncbi:MAG TPA: SDR family NAD(P)-dependent oxidoreductase [Flavitalea sp.]|nr:SDR family NAD(P)-dependent oxidoreductase [Flavitalea sp.]
MARVFVTGSPDGLGHLAAKALIAQGHRVVLHARNAQRGDDALRRVPEADAVITGDLGSIKETIRVAEELNLLPPFDAVIHNAGVYQVPPPQIFAVNTLAPYILTSLMHKPRRLIYLTSGMYIQGRFKPEDFQGTGRTTYSDSKLHMMILCRAVARKWTDVYANAVDPGWVPTKMGGRSAPDDLQKGYQTQVWLAASDDEKVKVSGRYFFHQKERPYNAEADDVALQEKFLKLCGRLTGVDLEGG